MATDLNNPHDRFFKATFGRAEVAAEFLELYLPPTVAAALNWTTLRAEKETFLDPELAQHPADLLYAVDRHDGEKSYVYLLFEHKSYVESRINLDLLRYRVRIWEQWLKDGNTGLLPVIIPVVFYHGANRWTAKRQFAETVAEAPNLQQYVPTCEYHLVDVSGYRDEALRGAVILQVALLTFKYIFRDELGERLPGILRLLRELEEGSSGLDFIRSLLRYLAQITGTSRLNETMLRQAVTQALTGGDEMMMSLAEQWVQEGWQKGQQEGWQKGRQEGLSSERQLVLRLVRKQFGVALMGQSRVLLERIEESTVLEELGEGLLDCADGEAWLAMLAQRASYSASGSSL
ncbi:MAG: Rpn family recombination-promoting nuclease/putative transposase [Candidatus Competibacteraceae bacterium]